MLISQKFIVYANTAAYLDQLKVIRKWLDCSDQTKGDVLIIQWNMKRVVKFILPKMCVRIVDYPDDLINQNKINPGILIATDGSIGGGIDARDVHSVVTVRFNVSDTMLTLIYFQPSTFWHHCIMSVYNM